MDTPTFNPFGRGFTLMSKALQGSHAGFTLIELLVVVSIIAILSTIGVGAYSGATKGARDAKRVADLKTIRNALEVYKQKNGIYPAGTAYSCLTSGLNCTGAVNPNWTTAVGGPEFYGGGQAPVDPVNDYDGSKNYRYTYIDGVICYDNLENKTWGECLHPLQ